MTEIQGLEQFSQWNKILKFWMML